MAIDGLITVPSAFDPELTMRKLEVAVQTRGMSVFARIDHAAGAQQVGLALRPTNLLVFGNAKGGTPLMQAAQTAAIDLPLKALVWRDEAGKTWLSYNSPAWVAARHGVGRDADKAVETLTAALEAVFKDATSDSCEKTP